MKADPTQAPVAIYSRSEYDRAVVNSALWAAAGDAVGWITELSRGPAGVEHRTGKTTITEPVAWQRFIGGRSGIKVDLPAGTYSDDTQLRLCVSRSIRSNGVFDVEAFAKIEITVWQGYCLGAGIGSKAAAANLSKRGVNWFSNFFATSRQKYTNAGGNGAAMRIQPHVWSANGTLDEMILSVMKDSIVTHGHPHGFCGAVFHALCLWDVLVTRKIPSLKAAKEFVGYMDRLPSIVESDNELGSFWKPSWEKAAGKSLQSAIQIFQDEAHRDISQIETAFAKSDTPSYHEILDRLGCLSNKYRGSGFKTALAAQVLSLLHSPENTSDALVESANELESDTDTIATMTGAMLGALMKHPPNWNIQDIAYIRSEAQRMADIARGVPVLSFSYPDVSVWKPPTNQSDAVVIWNGSWALAGIGVLEPQNSEYTSGSSVWQWFRLPFGQSVLAKRRSKIRSSVSGDQMPSEPLASAVKSGVSKVKDLQNTFEFAENGKDRNKPSNLKKPKSEHFLGLDEATDIVISSNFDDETIGRVINLCIDATGSIELTASLSAIIAKARIARLKRR